MYIPISTILFFALIGYVIYAAATMNRTKKLRPPRKLKYYYESLEWILKPYISNEFARKILRRASEDLFKVQRSYTHDRPYPLQYATDMMNNRENRSVCQDWGILFACAMISYGNVSPDFPSDSERATYHSLIDLVETKKKYILEDSSRVPSSFLSYLMIE